MNNFSVIYKILKLLEAAMDFDEFDTKQISPDRLGVTKQRWEKILISLVKAGYIEGVVYDQLPGDYSPHIEEPIRPVITLKGLEYLSENPLMKKAATFVKDVAGMIP